jgi:hypothetical protein
MSEIGLTEVVHRVLLLVETSAGDPTKLASACLALAGHSQVLRHHDAGMEAVVMVFAGVIQTRVLENEKKQRVPADWTRLSAGRAWLGAEGACVNGWLRKRCGLVRVALAKIFWRHDERFSLQLPTQRMPLYITAHFVYIFFSL